MHTESSSNHSHLEQQDFLSLVTGINREDALCHSRIANELPVISALCELIYDRLSKGGRLFYLGAGTSGRLGIVDASECPPTYGVPFDKVVGLIAGGDSALRKAVENAEDNTSLAWEDLQNYNITDKDVLVGIAASGTTPYVIGAIQECNKNKISVGVLPIHVVHHGLGDSMMSSDWKQSNEIFKKEYAYLYGNAPLQKFLLDKDIDSTKFSPTKFQVCRTVHLPVPAVQL